MTNWSTYALRDFIPFSDDVYLRMIERINETYWPLHFLAGLLFIALVFLVYKRKSKLIFIVLGTVWLWIAYAYMLEFYSELNWAGKIFAFACIAQALLLFVFAKKVSFEETFNPFRHIPAWLLIASSLFWPLFSPVDRTSWQGLEFVGIHADPTAVITLGILLMLSSLRLLAALALIPLMWILISLLTYLVMDLQQFWILLGVTSIFCLGLLTNTIIYWNKSKNLY